MLTTPPRDLCVTAVPHMPGGSKYMRHPFNSAGFPPEVRRALTSHTRPAPPLASSLCSSARDALSARRRVQVLRIPSFFK